jgi:hypothetical protein
MAPLSLQLPSERSRARVRLYTRVLIGLIVFLASHVLDQWAYQTLARPTWTEVYARKDWAMFFRTVGYVPLWLVVAGMIAIGQYLASAHRPVPDTRPVLLRSRVRPLLPPQAGVLLMTSCLLTGLACEVMQIVTLRHRPSWINQGTYMFDWVLDEKIRGSSHGLASSHAGVIFGIAWMFHKFHPALGFPMLALACACSLTRMYAGAHFLSDCVAAAVAAWIISDLLYRRWTGVR